ncbi:MAG: thiol oxidoreductase [Campylobacterales bacterium]|nr:thiol oxidoreductase [Campylobacterales bacterium]
MKQKKTILIAGTFIGLIGFAIFTFCNKEQKIQTPIVTKNSKKTLNKYFINKDSTCKEALSNKISDLTNDELDKVLLGQSFFRIPWVEAPSATTARDGLGPLFNANTCRHCHPNNGSGKVFGEDGKTLHRSFLFRLSKIDNFSPEEIENSKTAGFVPDPVYGAQFSISSTMPTLPEGKPVVKYTEKEIVYPDGEKKSLRVPQYSVKELNYGALDKNTVISARIASSLVGMGHLNNIKKEDILKNEDIQDKDNDGISGKAQWVYSPATGKTELGRFTWKASAPTHKHQSAAAFNNDMGITTPYFPKENCTPSQTECLKMSKLARFEHDATMERLDAVAKYISSHKVPIPKKTNKKGKEIFNNIGCVKCHVDRFVTKDGIVVRPYSDLLLHDMGEELSDKRSEFLAQGSEWRTQPLWGIGYKKATSGATDFLHDGRARDIEEAVLWHGGEAQKIKEDFMSLKKSDREDLIKFLNQL